jgi:hypothetical protein
VLRQAFAPGERRGFPVTLRPGGEDATEGKYDLTTLYDPFKPGRYTVQYVYEEKQGGWEGRLPSNEAAFEVVAKKEKGGRSESKAVLVQGLEFVALVPERVPEPPLDGDGTFNLGLRVTNISGKPLALRTFDVIRPRLYAVSGKRVAEVKIDIGRDGEPKPSLPALLAPGASWTWEPQATLTWTNDRKALRAGGSDGRGVGGAWGFTPCSPPQRNSRGSGIASPSSTPTACRRKTTCARVGTATTDEVAFEIAVWMARRRP